ncbi:hypothetical protein FGIG_05319 [Fasciola gigantica]|uniref:LITAF domain-containing protein n=1 Tax=Fasciola gigantica TaxID=46835 RepID=A0A504Z9C7_FASGI|nr:hypothetical protein FGIG_05319 [Fasciola gigantica]
MAATFTGSPSPQSKEARRGTVDLGTDQRRYSVQGVTEYQKMSHRPSLYGYPPPTTKLSLPLGGSIQEEPRASFSKPKLGGSLTSEDKFKLGREPVAFRCQTCQQPTMTVTSYHVGVITWSWRSVSSFVWVVSTGLLTIVKSLFKN